MEDSTLADSTPRAGYGSADIGNDSALLHYIVSTLIAKQRTAIPVQVVEVKAGGIGPIGRVTIKPLVQVLDGSRVAHSHGLLADVPYLRIQGGANAVIIDPQVGDVGMAVICDRDISVVKETGAEGPPGSNRKSDMSDAIYMSSIISVAPVQYLAFTDDGVVLKTPNSLSIEAASVDIKSSTLTHNGINVGNTHEHSGVQSGSAISGPPTP